MDGELDGTAIAQPAAVTNRPMLRRAIVVSLAVAAQLAGVPRAGVPQQPPQPTFRAGVTVVPIDVRVTDRDGRPVTDLKQEDFTIFEDGVRQQIIHFSSHVIAAQPPGPGMRARSDVPAVDLSPQEHRIFLIVIGAGAFGSKPLVSISPTGSIHGADTKVLGDPSKALDGLLHLVRDCLLPQDQVAVLAYNRASDFTTDHEGLARALEAFRESEEAGIAALARQSAPAPVQSPADSAFGTPARPITPPDAELGFAEYVEARNRRTGDLENLHYGIRYLRFMEGEKHLIYVTANGISQPPPGFLKPGEVREEPAQLAATANDARVALHVVQTAGLSSDPGEFLPPLPIMAPYLIDVRVLGLKKSGVIGGAEQNRAGGTGGDPGAIAAQPGWDRPPLDPGVPVPGMTALSLLALSDLRTLAELTGGHASIARNAGEAVDEIDMGTRAGYLLAYSPSSSASDGRYRAITVEVNRPGLTLFFRHGYYGHQVVSSLSRRAVVAEGRIAAAALSTKELRDIRVSVAPTFTKSRTGGGGEMLVQMVIDTAPLVWTSDDLSRHVSHLEFVVSCGTAGQKTIGQTRRRLNLALTDERFGQIARQGLSYSVRIPLSASARFVKVVVYNYESNLVGSALATIK